jgi:hypothetical protein
MEATSAATVLRLNNNLVRVIAMPVDLYRGPLRRFSTRTPLAR